MRASGLASISTRSKSCSLYEFEDLSYGTEYLECSFTLCLRDMAGLLIYWSLIKLGYLFHEGVALLIISSSLTELY